MGILNVTPDSFADGGRHQDPAAALDAALALVDAGADLLDVGGESTRPGADPVPAAEELARVTPVFRALAGRIPVPLSIDTYKSEVARAALDLGAAVVNDVSALEYDPALADVVAARGAALVLMHNRGRSREMYRAADYGSVADDVAAELEGRVTAAVERGIPRDRLVVDPGIGFAKRADHSLAALAGLAALQRLDRPILVGPSRKSFLQAAIGDRPPAGRDRATAAAVTAAVLEGAHVVRVHDVAACIDAVRVADALRRAGGLDAS